MDRYHFVRQLLQYERRVGQIYEACSTRPEMAPALRGLWRALAEDERQHAAVLERSAVLFGFSELMPEDCAVALTALEPLVAAAEAAVLQEALSPDEALRHALVLEGSELNLLYRTWVQSFAPAYEPFLPFMVPEDAGHLSRLVEAVQRYGMDPALREESRRMQAASAHQQGVLYK